MGWIKYFKERPYGLRDDHRAAILTQTTYQGKKKLDVESLFPSLSVFKNNEDANKNRAKGFINSIQSKSKSANKIKIKD